MKAKYSVLVEVKSHEVYRVEAETPNEARNSWDKKGVIVEAGDSKYEVLDVREIR